MMEFLVADSLFVISCHGVKLEACQKEEISFYVVCSIISLGQFLIVVKIVFKGSNSVIVSPHALLYVALGIYAHVRLVYLLFFIK